MRPISSLDDAALAMFLEAAAGTTPLKASDRIAATSPPLPPLPIQSLLDEHDALAESIYAPISVEQIMDAGDEPTFLRKGVPRSIFRKLRRARWVAQSTLDLHGMNRNEAHSAIVTFVKKNRLIGNRCVRIIHGKGLGSPGREPVLKSKVATWLAIREDVLAFCQAPGHLGGSGALLVLLCSRD